MLTYAATAGEANAVTITQNGTSFTVRDDGANVTADAGCAPGSNPSEAVCTASIQSITAELNDLNDAIDLDVQVPTIVFGRAGDDELNGGVAKDTVNGGPGVDSINVRDGAKGDTVLCEPGNNDTVAYDPAPVLDNVEADCFDKNPAPLAVITGGPTGPTNDTTPTFTFAAAPGETGVTGFECRIDGFDDGWFPCDSGAPQPEISANFPYFFRVRALDAVPGAGPSVGQAFEIDTAAPQVTVTVSPSGNVQQANFTLSSNEANTTFECAIDQGDFAPCSSPYTSPVLPNGAYLLSVRGTDMAGNPTTTEFPFVIPVQTAGGGTGGGGGGGAAAAPVKPSKIIIESLVLISGRPVKMSRKGEVPIRLQCAGTSTCKGRMSITTAEPVKRKSRKLERLGTVKFTIAANKSKRVKVRFSKSKQRLAKRLKRFKAKVVINEVDQRGNARISSRVFVLRAR